MIEWGHLSFRYFSGRQPLALLLSSPKEVSKKGATVSGGGRRPGGLPPRSPAEDQRSAISLPASLGPTLRAEGNVPQPAEKPLRKRKLCGRICFSKPATTCQSAKLCGRIQCKVRGSRAFPKKKAPPSAPTQKKRQRPTGRGRTVSPGLQGKAGCRTWRER